ncbi:MAG: hypothetical protein AAGC56_14435 [Pseudomonadota bacterium]
MAAAADDAAHRAGRSSHYAGYVLRRVVAAARNIGDRPFVTRTLQVLRAALFAAILVYLVVRLTQVGWFEIIRAAPTSPWFYGFFVLRFLTLPLSELALYERIWSVSLVTRFPVFLRKRVYNFGVVGYSGEGFLTLWARRSLPLGDRAILAGVKDNNILSAFTSNVFTVVMLGGLALSGGLAVALSVLPNGAGAVFAAAGAVAALAALVIAVFARRILTMPIAAAKRLVPVHAARMALILILQGAGYAAAVPEAPLSAWAIILTVNVVVTRLPLIPNQDLAYLGAGLALAPALGASEAAVAAVLAAEAALAQAANAGLFVATSGLAGDEARSAPRSTGRSTGRSPGAGRGARNWLETAVTSLRATFARVSQRPSGDHSESHGAN